MKITEVKVIVTCPGRNFVFVKVMTDVPGLYGVGEGTLNGSEPIVAEAIRHMSHLLIGRDPQRIEDTWHLLYRQGYWRGGPIFMAAIAAIDFALWDIKGKQAGLPVYQLLGGRARDGVMCYTHASGRDAVECEDSARSIMARGFKVVRCQVGPYGGAGVLGKNPPTTEGTPPEQIYEPTPYLLSVPKLFAHLRDKLGMEIELFHDSHEQLNPIEAARLAKELEPYRLFFLEDPLMPEHRESWPILRAASTTPLAIGEILTSRWDCLPLFMNKWIDFIRIKPLHVGGLTEARKILTLAEPFNVRSAFHGAADIGPIAQAASITLQSVIPNFGVQEWTKYPEPTYEVVSGICRMESGFAYPNEAPGLGVDIDEEKAAQYPYKLAFMPLVRRADGSMHVY
ncbi:MAG TPA: D-galactonate dehydratase family protein [Chthonomonadaceae bacterium]|nr:D-galactonate dehydratase family protein [Chthonomonadaceae bacterium]